MPLPCMQILPIWYNPTNIKSFRVWGHRTMSAGAFQVVNYQFSNGDIGSIRIQPETATALTIGGEANTEVAGVRNVPRRVTVSGGRRRQGLLYSRLVRLTWTGAPPAGYKPASVVTVPLINNAIYAAASVPDATGTYLGAGVRVVGVTPQPI